MEKKRYVEYIDLNNNHHIEERKTSDFKKYLNNDDIIAVRFFNRNIENNKENEKSRVTPFYYKNVTENELTIEEKVNSDNAEFNERSKYKNLEKHIGEYVRVHYYMIKDTKLKEYNLLGILNKINYFNNIIILTNNSSITIPFIEEGSYIDYINTKYDIIYESSINKEDSYIDNANKIYGKNILEKRKKRRK